MIISRFHKKIFLCILFFLIAAPISLFLLKQPSAEPDFEEYLNTWFIEDVSSNPINLHYTLANPQSFGITMTNFHLNSSTTTNVSVLYENRLKLLNSFSSEQLTSKQQLTKDILCLYYETELSGNAYSLLEEFLSPSLGIQAQLPILLAEYTFRTEEDVQNYLRILTSVYPYFKEIVAFEKEKSIQGTFMSDTTAQRIIEQCSAFISDPENNYLDSIFQNNINQLDNLTEKKKYAYIELHTKLIQTQIIPAYQMLIDELTHLMGTGKNNNGLYYLANGTEYYEYLLKSNCGLYESVSDIQNRLLQQMESDLNLSEQIISQNPNILEKLSLMQTQSEQTPQEILEYLQQKMLQDFPSTQKISYEIKYVHEDLEEYLSPAFYLTPPIDTLDPNTIYINPNDNLNGIELFTTLAHEGFPGHLYQTITFSSSNPSPIRHMLNMGGYIEGWATYVESYAYNYYAENSASLTLSQINRSLNLCILSFLDTKIHYDGWTLSDTSTYLSWFGILDTSTHKEVYQTIVEDPTNYLKYYMGYLHFADLRDAVKEDLKEDFSIQKYHKKVLEIGPCQFPILEAEVLEYFCQTQ